MKILTALGFVAAGTAVAWFAYAKQGRAARGQVAARMTDFANSRLGRSTSLSISGLANHASDPVGASSRIVPVGD